MPACSINFFNKLGFLRDTEPASLSLKWMSCFFSVRKCANFVFAEGFGEPGGDGGMSRFGTGGSVKLWTRLREIDCPSKTPCAGPRTGPLGSRSRSVSDAAGGESGIC